MQLSREDAFDFNSAEYAALFETSDATAFQHPLWLQHFYAILAPARNAMPAIICGRNGEGLLQFVLPLITRKANGAKLLEATHLGISDYCCPIIAADFLRACEGTEVLAAETYNLLPNHDILRISNIRDEHQRHWQLLLGTGFIEHDYAAHAADLPSAIETFRNDHLTASMRKYLKRKRNTFFKQDEAKLVHITAPEEAKQAIHALAAIRAGRFDGDMIADPAVETFYSTIAEKGAVSGFADIYALSVSSSAIAYLFSITSKGALHYLLIGADYEQHGHLSPGMVLYDTIIEDWISRGGTRFDFTIGDEAFKSDFATKPTQMFHLTRAESAMGKLALAGLATRERVKSLLKANAQTLAGAGSAMTKSKIKSGEKNGS